MINLIVPPCPLALHSACRLIISCLNDETPTRRQSCRSLRDDLIRFLNMLDDIPQCYDVKVVTLGQVGYTTWLKAQAAGPCRFGNCSNNDWVKSNYFPATMGHQTTKTSVTAPDVQKATRLFKLGFKKLALKVRHRVAFDRIEITSFVLVLICGLECSGALSFSPLQGPLPSRVTVVALNNVDN